MSLIKTLLATLRPSVHPDDIISAMDPWMLACAVGAENGSIGTSIGFDMWFRLSKENWMPEVVRTSGASERQIEGALRAFVARNSSKNYQTVLRNEEAIRGRAPSPILGPGESMTVSVPLTLSNGDC